MRHHGDNGPLMADLPDEDLVRRAREGDRGAFDALVLRHQDRVYNCILRIVLDRSLAEDVCQKVFLNAYLRLRDFTGGSQFFTWLYRIAHNESISVLRYEGRRRGPSLDLASSDDDASGLPEPASPDGDPSLPAARADNERILHDALKRIDPEERQVLILRELEGLDYRQIADALDLPVGTVRSRLHRARESLREVLRPKLGTIAAGAASKKRRP